MLVSCFFVALIRLTHLFCVYKGYLAITKARLNSGGIHLKAELTLEPQTAVSCDYQPGDNKEDEMSGRYEHRRVAFKTIDSQKAQLESTPTAHRRVAHEDVRENSPSRKDPETTKIIDTDPTDVEKPTPTTTIAKPTDPLSAFGFMARNVLKPAQNQFNSALSFIIDAADAAQELRMLERKYMGLLDKKKSLAQ